MSDAYDNSGSFPNATFVQGSDIRRVGQIGDRHYYQLPADQLPQDKLRQAQALFATLPPDTVPEPGVLPEGSRMLGRNPLFTGRADDLKALAAAMRRPGATAIGEVAAATGMGGMGKSQLAVEFAHRYGRYFAGGVYWLNFDTAEAVTGEIAQCVPFMGLSEDGTREQRIQRVRTAWANGVPRLLIFDNCEEPDLLAKWRPSSGGARILVTARRPHWPPELVPTCRPIGVLSPDESIALLRRFRDLTDADAGRIADAVGRLPLALHMAGSYLRKYRHSPLGQPEAYLTALQKEALLGHASLCKPEFLPIGYDCFVAATFTLSHARLIAEDSPETALARQILAHAACFAPGLAIPRALLKQTLGAVDEEAAEDALYRLMALGLLEQDKAGALVVHRLLAAFAEQVEAMDAARDRVEECLGVEARRILDAGRPKLLVPWSAHLRVVADAAEARRSKLAGGLLTLLGYHLNDVAAYAEAKAARERALRISETTLGPEHPTVALHLNNLAITLWRLGDLADAQAVLERVLRIDEAALGPDHPDVATDLSNLGSVLRAMGDLPGALVACERALRINEAAQGPDHPEVATRLNNLGTVLNDRGDLPGARTAFERALRIDEAAWGPDHPWVATGLNNLGHVLWDLGERIAATAALERAVRIRIDELGPQHPHTLISINNLEFIRRALAETGGAGPGSAGVSPADDVDDPPA